MSAVNLCERCDSLMLGKAVATLNVADNPQAKFETYELCPPCIAEFHDFMHAVTVRDKQVYRDAYTAPLGEDVKQLEG